MDKRIIKSKKSIHEALLKLISTKSANKITVSEIARVAEIERKTFYLHYSCIEDVYVEVAQNIATEIENEVEKYITDSNNYQINNIFTALNTVITNNISFFRVISRNDSYSFLLLSFEDALARVITKIAKEIYHIKSPNINYYTDFYASGIIKLYKGWLRNDNNLSLERLTMIVTRVCFLSVDELTK